MLLILVVGAVGVPAMDLAQTHSIRKDVVVVVVVAVVAAAA